MREGIAKLTNVAEIPGYPTRKLLLGGPETRTEACSRSAIFARLIRLVVRE